jgi:hypothetical protein
VRARVLRERWRTKPGTFGQIFDSLRAEAGDDTG